MSVSLLPCKGCLAPSCRSQIQIQGCEAGQSTSRYVLEKTCKNRPEWMQLWWSNDRIHQTMIYFCATQVQAWKVQRHDIQVASFERIHLIQHLWQVLERTRLFGTGLRVVLGHLRILSLDLQCDSDCSSDIPLAKKKTALHHWGLDSHLSTPGTVSVGGHMWTNGDWKARSL